MKSLNRECFARRATIFFKDVEQRRTRLGVEISQPRHGEKTIRCARFHRVEPPLGWYRFGRPFVVSGRRLKRRASSTISHDLDATRLYSIHTSPESFGSQVPKKRIVTPGTVDKPRIHVDFQRRTADGKRHGPGQQDRPLEVRQTKGVVMSRTRPHLYWITASLLAALSGCVTTDPSLLTTRAEQARMAYDPGMKVMQSGSGRTGGGSAGSQGTSSGSRGGSIGRSTSAAGRGASTAAIAANWSRNWNGNRAAGVASSYFPMNGAAEPSAPPAQMLTANRTQNRRASTRRPSAEGFGSQAEIVASNGAYRGVASRRRVDAELTIASTDPTKDENPRGSSTFLPVAIDLPVRSETSPIDRQIARAGAEGEEFLSPGAIAPPAPPPNGPVVPFGAMKPSTAGLTSSSRPNSTVADEGRIAQTGSVPAGSLTHEDDFIQPLPIVPFRAPEAMSNVHSATSTRNNQAESANKEDSSQGSSPRIEAKTPADTSAAAADRQSLDSKNNRSFASKSESATDPRRGERDRADRTGRLAQNNKPAPRANSNVNPPNPAASASNRREIALEYVKDGIDDPTLWGRPRLARLNNNPRAVGLYVERPIPPFPQTYYSEAKKPATEERSITTNTGATQTGLTQTVMKRSFEKRDPSTASAAKQSIESKPPRLVAAITALNPFQKSTRENTLDQSPSNGSVEAPKRSFGKSLGEAIEGMKTDAWKLVSKKKDLNDNKVNNNIIDQNASLRVASSAPVVPGRSAPPIAASRSNAIAGVIPGSNANTGVSNGSRPLASASSNPNTTQERETGERSLQSDSRQKGSSDRRVRLTGAAIDSKRVEANSFDPNKRGLRSPKAPDPSTPAISPAQTTSTNPKAAMNRDQTAVSTPNQQSVGAIKRPFVTAWSKAKDAISAKANDLKTSKNDSVSEKTIVDKPAKTNDAKSGPEANLRPASTKRFRLFGRLRDSIDKRFGPKKATGVES